MSQGLGTTGLGCVWANIDTRAGINLWIIDGFWPGSLTNSRCKISTYGIYLKKKHFSNLVKQRFKIDDELPLKEWIRSQGIN